MVEVVVGVVHTTTTTTTTDNNSNDDWLDVAVSPVGDGVWEPWLGLHHPSLEVGEEVAAVAAEEDDNLASPALEEDNYLAIANLRVLFRQERAKDYKVADYLGIQSANQANVNRKRKRDEHMPRRPPWKMDACNRWEIGEWCYGLIGDFSFPLKFAEITMSYVDRYMSRCCCRMDDDNNNKLCDPPSTKQEVELLALTCFYLAVKLYQTGPVLSARQMAVLSGGTYGIKEISAMEKKILFVLNWRLHPPCPTDFVCTFFLLLSTHEILSPCEPWEDQVLVLARRMLESATLDYCIVLHGVLPSHLAAAVLIHAVSLVQPEPWVPDASEIIQVLNDHSDFAMNPLEIDWCLDRIRQICPTRPRVPVLTPDSTFDEDEKAKEEWQPDTSPSSVTTVRDFSKLPYSLPCFY